MLENKKELFEKYPCNVISDQEFKKSIRDIFDMLAGIVGKTLGPYGGLTWIEEMGAYHPTKDGFTVLKNIRFNSRRNNTILNFINSISHQMVMKVGDGSTTAIVAAHEFLEEAMNADKYLMFNTLRPKDISTYISKIADELSDIIQQNATKVPDEEFVNIMEKISRIATNDNDEYTNYIKEIYEKSGPETYITKRMSMTADSSYDIMDGMFYIAGRYVDKIYCNSDNGAKCRINNPLILCFNFTLGNEHWDIIKVALKWVMANRPTQRIVVISPNYDQYFMDHVRADTADFISAYQEKTTGGAIPFPLVFVKNPFFKSVERVIYDDLPPFLGTRMISPLDAENVLKQLGEYYKVASYYNQVQNTVREQNELRKNLMLTASRMNKSIDDPMFQGQLKEIPNDLPDSGENIIKELEEKISSWFGTCGVISIGNETVEFYELDNKNEGVIHAHVLDARDQYNRELNSIENYRYITKEYIEAQERLSRISCKSAIIRVGGNSDLEKKLNDDTLDDAIRACRSTIVYGYNLGNNFAIFKAITELKKKFAISSDKDSVIYAELLDLLKAAFYRVIHRIYLNKNESITLEETKNKVDNGLNLDACFDLNTTEFSKNIINSARTDIEILKGAISIIGTIISANQYLAVEIQQN